jgi:diguanylate cyclase (GGDEF)-like protein
MQFAFGAVVAVLLAAAVVAYHGVIASTESAHWAQHTNEVLERLANLRSGMENVETGYRDFVLSGNEGYLRLSRDNVAFVDHEMKSLRELTADNPHQQRRLAILADMVRLMVQRDDAIVRSGRTSDAGAAAAVIHAGQADPILDEIRAVAGDMGDEERRLLQMREAAGERSFHQTRIALILASALAFAIAAAFAWRVTRDLAERKSAEAKLSRLNRLYAMVSATSALGLRVRDRDDLFRSACRIAVEQGEFEMAWIGVVDRPEAKIVPMAWAGIDEKTMAAIKGLFSTGEGALGGKTLAARAIRDKAPVVSNDVEHDDSLLFGRMHAASGVRSIAMLPLIVADRAIGVMVLYTSKLEFFDSAGLQLLTELAGNVALAIDHMEKQERLDHLAYYDALTGLANLSLFLDRVTQHMIDAVNGGHKLAVFLLDLERFKKFNDTLGRPAGDALLIQVAEWLAKNAGNVGMLSRVAADHFAVVLPDVRYEADVVRLLEATVAAFLIHPFTVDDVEYRIAARVGVALFPDDGTDAGTVFRNAEAALKKAKVGRDRYLFYAQKMTDSVAGSLGIENRLRQALEKGEFVLYYQPKVSLADGRLTGAEALIRWNDPQSGLVPPARFISILEETGLIHEVGRWALATAIDDHRRWRSAQLPAVRIAVNVSPLQLRSRSFVSEIEEAVGNVAGAASGLELEITESLIMEDVNRSIVSLLALRALGITIAIDDFGTGFSSLSYLSKLPVDTLKIDRSFVVDMTSGAGGLTLVSVIINLAHALKLNTVAEGVETEDELRQLRILHCDEMQGYLFGKPVPVAIFEKKYLGRV